MIVMEHEIFGFIKPSLDAHTLGINAIGELLSDCGYQVIVGDQKVGCAINNFKYEENKNIVIQWIRNHHISRLGFSYRLDEKEAVNIFGSLMHVLKNNNLLYHQGGPIKSIYFGGLPKACQMIESEYNGYVKTFQGGETIQDTLLKMDIPESRIPKDIREGSSYDKMRMEFGRDIIKSQKYMDHLPVDRSGYSEYGTFEDSLIKRLDFNNNKKVFYPLTRAHVGPYSSTSDRVDSVKEFISWSQYLASSQFLDILSIGSSQLTQSQFGEDWGDACNGGGVPVNSPEEYKKIWEASRPLLVRTYAGTKNIPQLADIHEKTLNISWHALSLWWFNKMDGRGPYDLYTNLKQHIETLKYIAKSNKPFEPNVPHHFAFRGADDVTYIVSAYLSVKLAKKMGIKTLILQNMLNTPRTTWGIQDLAKSRAMLMLVKNLEDNHFRVLLQPRAGLDYFSPDLNEAKIQLAAVSALMDDIDPHNETSPPIIHVVSYSEASHLATPEIINESIKITQFSIQKYREQRRKNKIEDMSNNQDVQERMMELIDSATTIISAIESLIEHPYTAEGLYKIFASGFLPTPYLWGETDEFKHAKVWQTKPVKGSIKLIDKDNNFINSDAVVHYAKTHLKELDQIVKHK